jgi:hypothetical protein
MTNKIDDSIDKATNQVRESAEKATDKAQDLAHAVTDKTRELVDKAGAAVVKVGEKIKDLIG